MGTVASGRRLITLLIVAALVGVPALVLRIFCVGQSCPDQSTAGAAAVPFCPLPADVRTLIQHGFYENGRSPDAFALAKTPNVAGGTGTGPTGAAPVWPDLSVGAGRTDGLPVTQVPIVFSGSGVSAGAKVPTGTGLDDIAPTIATAIDIPNEHPELRAGKPIPGLAGRTAPRLVLEIVWAGIGSRALGDAAGTPFLRTLMKSGAGTLGGTTGSLPVDSTAALTTIGTGALPFQHGIIGSVLRNKNGDLAQAWSEGAPISVLPTLGDDLTYRTDGKAMLGLVAPDTLDRGIVGGHWYPQTPDRAQIILAGNRSADAAANRLLAKGFGSDDTPDILAVVLDRTGVHALDAQTRAIVESATRAAGGSVMVVVAGTGDAGESMTTDYVPAQEVVGQIEQQLGAPVVAEAVPGGLFLDQDVLESKGITAGKVVTALNGVRGPPPGRELLMDQAFPAFSITFARYC